ncbi:putative reverse transcriptase domain-containing protein [Tanacetum coccineum]
MRMRRESGAEDADYVQRAMIQYENNTRLPFKLRHCWEILKDHPKFQEIAIPNSNTGSEGGSKRHKSYGSSSFNTEYGEASINLNTTVGDNDEDEV